MNSQRIDLRFPFGFVPGLQRARVLRTALLVLRSRCHFYHSKRLKILFISIANVIAAGNEDSNLQIEKSLKFIATISRYLEEVLF